MALDALHMRALRHELASQLEGSRVEKVRQPYDKSLVLQVFPPRGAELTFQVDSKSGFVALTRRRWPSPPTPPTFCQLARSRLEGSRVVAVHHPTLDRRMSFDLVRRDEDGGEDRYTLVLELFGTMADLYLLEGDRILGHIRRGPLAGRIESGTYTAPEPPPGIDPLGMSPAALEALLTEAVSREGEKDALRHVCRSLQGIGTDTARVFTRLTREIGAAAAAASFLEYRSKIEQGVLDPGILVAGSGARTLLAHPVAGRPETWDWTPVPSFSEGVEEVLLEDILGGQMASRRATAVKQLEEMTRRQEDYLQHTRTSLERAGEADRIEQLGNLMKSQLAKFKKYQDFVEITDYYADGTPTIRVPVKKDLPPMRNIDLYFARAKKRRRSLPSLEMKEREHQENLEALAELRQDLEAMEGLEGLERVEERIVSLSRSRAPRPGGRGPGRVPGGARPATGKDRKGADGYLSFLSSDGLRIYVGRNNSENDRLTRKHGKKGTLWLHAHGVPGSHVILKPEPGQDCPDRSLEEAAMLAAHYSKARYSGKVEVMVADASTVKKGPELGPGQVHVLSFRTVVVKVDPTLPGKLSKPL